MKETRIIEGPKGLCPRSEGGGEGRRGSQVVLVYSSCFNAQSFPLLLLFPSLPLPTFTWTPLTLSSSSSPHTSSPGQWGQAPPHSRTCTLCLSQKEGSHSGLRARWPGMKGSNLFLWSILGSLSKDLRKRGIGRSLGL